jgi:hypothetical protein
MYTERHEFDSEFCRVKYMEEEQVVLLTWKQYCCSEDYRRPALFALDLLNKFNSQVFIIDARNGFEDAKEDVEWGFLILLPAMAKTACKNVVFIMNTVNEIEEEMDMWTNECLKYFKVKKAACYEDAVKCINEDL